MSTETTAMKADSRAAREQGSQDIDKALVEIRQDVATLARSIAGYGKLRADGLGDEVKEFSEDVLRETRQRLEALTHRLSETEKAVEKNAREHPAQWLGGILGLLGAGIIFGLLFSRRH